MLPTYFINYLPISSQQISSNIFRPSILKLFYQVFFFFNSSLHLSGNQLEYLPEEISGCQSLIDLYVGANKLKCLPRSIVNLTRLAHLCATINELECLPLIPFVSLPRIFFDFNPSINHLPFVFGCQQNVAAFSALRRNWPQGNQVRSV